MNRMPGGRGGSFRPPAIPGQGLLGQGPGRAEPGIQGGDGFRKMGGGMAPDPYQPAQMDGGMGQLRGGGMRGEIDHRPMGHSQMDSQGGGMGPMRGVGMRSELDQRPMGRSEEMDRRPMARPMDSQDGGQMRGGMDRRPMGRDLETDRRDPGMDRRPMGRDPEMDRRPMGRDQEMDRRPMGRDPEIDRRPMGRDPEMDRRPMGRDSEVDRRPMGRELEMERQPIARSQMDNQGGGAIGQMRGGMAEMDRRPMGRDNMDSRGGGGVGQMRGGSTRNEPPSLLDSRHMDERQMDRLRMDGPGGGMDRVRTGPPRREPMPDSRAMEPDQYDRGRMDKGPGMRADPDRRPPPQMGGRAARPEVRDPPSRDMERRTGPMDQARHPDRPTPRGNLPDRPMMRTAGGPVSLLEQRDIGGSNMEQRGGFMDRRMDDRRQTDYPSQQPRDLRDEPLPFPATQQGYGDGLIDLPTMRQQTMETFVKPQEQFTGVVYNMEQPSAGGVNFLEQKLAQARQELLQRQQEAALEEEQLSREKDEAMLRATMLQAQEKLHRSSRAGDGILGSGPAGGRMPPPGSGRGGPGRGRPPPSLLTMAPIGRGKRPGIGDDRYDSKKPRREQPSPDRRASSTAQQRPSRRDQAPGHQDGARRKTRFDSSPLSKTRDRKDSDRSSGSQGTYKAISLTTAKSNIDKAKSGAASSKDTSKETEVTITLSDQYDPTEPTGDIKDEHEEEPMEEEDKENGVKVEDVKEDPDKHQETSLTVTVSKKGRSVSDSDKKPEDKKVFKCNICNIDCYDEIAFSRHLKAPRHMQKMKTVIDVSKQQSTQALARKQAEEHLRKLETPPRPPTRTSDATGLELFCKTCEKNYSGGFKLHKESKEHKMREDRRKAGCKLCNVRTFNTFEGFAQHLQSNWHKRKEKQAWWPHCKLCDQRFKSPRKFVQHCKTPHHIENKEKSNYSDDEDFNEMVTLDTVGFEDDSAALEAALEALANSVDPDEPARNEPSLQDLHCLQSFS